MGGSAERLKQGTRHAPVMLKAARRAETDPDAPVASLAKQLVGSNGHGKVTFGREAGLFDSIASVPAVVVGPGSIEQAHKAGEWIAITELDRCASFVGRLHRALLATRRGRTIVIRLARGKRDIRLPPICGIISIRARRHFEVAIERAPQSLVRSKSGLFCHGR